MKLYLVRHAKSKRNIGEKDSKDTKLHKDGKEQARRLGRYFHKLKLDTMYCSPLKRALATLEAIKPYIQGAKIIITKQIVEHKMGIYEKNGKDDWTSYARDSKKAGIEFIKFRPKKGDSLLDTYNRMGKFYKKILKKHHKEKILIVGHGISLLHLILNILNLEPKEGAYFQLSNASVSTLDIDKKGNVRSFHINDYNHLIQEGIRIKKENLKEKVM
jgi:broad specificity phosphatase PhoE